MTTTLLTSLIDSALLAAVDGGRDDIARHLTAAREAAIPDESVAIESDDPSRRADGAYQRADAGTAQDDGTVVICSDGEARDGHIIDVATLQTVNYKDNPVLYYNHAYTEDDALPIGSIEPDSIVDGMSGDRKVLVGRVAFHRLTQQSTEIAALWEAKQLRFVSVTWRRSNVDADTIPRRQLPIDHPAYKADSWGCWFKNAEVIEVSVVGVPSDTRAKRIRSGGGITITRRVAAEVAAEVDTTTSSWWE